MWNYFLVAKLCSDASRVISYVMGKIKRHPIRLVQVGSWNLKYVSLPTSHAGKLRQPLCHRWRVGLTHVIDPSGGRRIGNSEDHGFGDIVGETVSPAPACPAFLNTQFHVAAQHRL